MLIKMQYFVCNVYKIFKNIKMKEKYRIIIIIIIILHQNLFYLLCNEVLIMLLELPTAIFLFAIW